MQMMNPDCKCPAIDKALFFDGRIIEWVVFYVNLKPLLKYNKFQ